MLTYAPITISSSEVILSTVVVIIFPLCIEGISETYSVLSFSPLTKILIESPSNVAATNVHSSFIVLVYSTVVHLMPSKTENFATFDGLILLLIASENDFSLLITVNSDDPLE